MPKDRFNEVKLYYELSGTSEQAIVLVHGSWVDHYNWGYLIPYLEDSYRVLNYDRRGHSQSERPAGQGSIVDDISDLVALITHFDLAPAHIVGSSYGGIITLKLAAEKPELFKSIIVHEPPILELNEATISHKEVASIIQMQKEVVKQLEVGQLEYGTSHFINSVIHPDAWEEMPEDFQEALFYNAPSFVDDVNDPEPWTVDLDKLAKISVPILLTGGENSAKFFSIILDQLQQALPKATRITIPGVDHGPQIDRPEEYADIILKFIQESTER